MILEGVVGSFCDNDVWKRTGNKAPPSLRKEGRGDGSRGGSQAAYQSHAA